MPHRGIDDSASLQFSPGRCQCQYHRLYVAPTELLRFFLLLATDISLRWSYPDFHCLLLQTLCFDGAMVIFFAYCKGIALRCSCGDLTIAQCSMLNALCCPMLYALCSSLHLPLLLLKVSTQFAISFSGIDGKGAVGILQEEFLIAGFCFLLVIELMLV